MSILSDFILYPFSDKLAIDGVDFSLYSESLMFPNVFRQLCSQPNQSLGGQKVKHGEHSNELLPLSEIGCYNKFSWSPGSDGGVKSGFGMYEEFTDLVIRSTIIKTQLVDSSMCLLFLTSLNITDLHRFSEFDWVFGCNFT